MKSHITFLLLLLLAVLPVLAQTDPPNAPAAPQYIVASGISYDAIGKQASSVSTLGVKIGEVRGLPTYQLTTIEQSLVAQAGDTDTAATLRAGVWQTVYQAPSRAISVGVCTDVGVTKIGDEATVGTLSGCGGIVWDVGAKVTKGKHHLFVIPVVRLIAVNGIQVKPSYSLRIGTGF